MSDNTQSTNDPLTLESYKELLPLARAYEFQPGKAYLIIADGKNFKYGAVNNLLHNFRESHPDIDVHIIVSAKPNSLEVMEKKEDVSTEGNL